MQLHQYIISFVVACTLVQSDICISGTSTSNAIFFGNYVQASIPDSNGNIYYEKQQSYSEQQDCSMNNKQEYLYLRNDEWQTNYILNDPSSYLKCSSPSLTPDQCIPLTWNNGGNIDTSITVTNIPCPPIIPIIPTISCSGSIKIESTNSKCSGVFNQIENGLYKKEGSCGPYFYYNSYRELWECGPMDKRSYCWSLRGTTTYYLRSKSNRIGTLINGDTITINLVYPATETASITCGGAPVYTPMISCNVIELKNAGNCDANGIYTSVMNRPNLYEKVGTDGIIKYFQYSELTQTYLIADGDVTNECDAASTYTYYLKSTDYSIGSLINGQHDLPLQLEFPIATNVNSPTISCLANLEPPLPAVIPKAGDLCVVIPLWLNDCPNDWKVSGLYESMVNVNGFPAYQLNGNCGSIRYLFYVEYYQRYAITDTLTNPPNEIYFYCTNRGSDLAQCQWSNSNMIEMSDALTRVGGCDCNSQL